MLANPTDVAESLSGGRFHPLGMVGRVSQATETTDSSGGVTGRLRSTGEVARSFLSRIPFSLTVAIALVVTAILTGTITGPASTATQDAWAAGVHTTLDAGHWWSVLSALVIPWDPFQLVAGVLATLALLGVAERRMGTARAIIAFVVTGAAGIAIGVALQWLGSLAGEWWSTETAADLTLDPLTGILGALITATAFMGSLWRRRFRVVTLAAILVFVLYDGDSSNAYRFIAILIGYPLGALLSRDPSALSMRRSSHAETRTLVATIVAVTGIGPLVALVNGSELTPFAYISYLFADEAVDPATVLAKCGGPTTVTSEECLRQLTLLSGQGFGMLLLSFLPLALLLLAAWGLARGRRFAMWLAIGVNAAVILFARTALDVTDTLDGDDDLSDWSLFDLGELLVWILAAAVLPLVVIIILIVSRRHFTLTSPRPAYVRFIAVTVTAFIVLATSYYVFGLATLGDYAPPANPFDLLLDTFKRFIPPHFLGATDPIIVTTHDIAEIAYQAVGPIFWTIFIVSAVRLMRATESRVRAPEYARIRAILKRGGGGTLGFMATWPGNVYWFSADGEAAVAYRVINGIALTMSDPLCSEDRAEQTIHEFAAYCDQNSWVPVFYSVHPQYLPIFEAMGWQHMSVGEETLVPTVGLELTGKPWQKVRQALNRGIKEGLTTVWTRWDDLPRPTIAAINAISEEWVAEKELPEMGFTLGGMEELKDPDVALMLALGPDGRIQAVTSWLPSYRDGKVVGWTIDFMRRTDDSMNGVMEFLIASAALHMKETGAEVLSLSGAPLATKPLPAGETAPEPTVMTRLSEFLAKTLEPAYGFSSLFRFKAKFNPTYETISMAYPDPLALPAIGIAVGRAYLPDVSPKEAIALVKTLTK